MLGQPSVHRRVLPILELDGRAANCGHFLQQGKWDARQHSKHRYVNGSGAEGIVVIAL